MGRKPHPAVTAAYNAVKYDGMTARDAAELHGCTANSVRRRLKQSGDLPEEELVGNRPRPKLVKLNAVDAATLSYTEQLERSVRLLSAAVDEASELSSHTSLARLALQLRQAQQALHEERLRLKALAPVALEEVNADQLVEEYLGHLEQLPRALLDSIVRGALDIQERR